MKFEPGSNAHWHHIAHIIAAMRLYPVIKKARRKYSGLFKIMLQIFFPFF